MLMEGKQRRGTHISQSSDMSIPCHLSQISSYYNYIQLFSSFLRKKVAFHIVGTHVLGDWICLPVPTQMAKTQFRGGRGRTKFQANSTFTQRSWEEEEGRKERKSWLLYLKLHLGTGRKWTKKTRPPFFLKSEKKNTLVYAFLMLAMWTAFW